MNADPFSIPPGLEKEPIVAELNASGDKPRVRYEVVVSIGGIIYHTAEFRRKKKALRDLEDACVRLSTLISRLT